MLNLREDDQLEYWFKDYNVDDKTLEMLYSYYELIYEYNQVMNLTGVDDLHGVFLKHFYDSLTITRCIKFENNMSIADVGTGAGFPGIVLAICYPKVDVTLIEPLKKRCNFLQVVVDKLGLKNVEIINKRSEEIDMEFDIVVSRAVARLNILTELCLPHVKLEGFFIALKGKNGQEEVQEAKKAIKILGGDVYKLDKFNLPVENSNRMNVVIRKIKRTEKKYPRNFSQIKSKPL